MLHIQLKSSSTRVNAIEHYTTKRGYLFKLNLSYYKSEPQILATKKPLTLRQWLFKNYY
jgi:hypothetical protein